MNTITKIILGLLGIAVIGLLSYYVVTKDKNSAIAETPITNPDQDTVATAKVLRDTQLAQIKKALNIEGEDFTPTETEGVFTNATNDKLIIIKEDIWKKILRNAQGKFPKIAADCNQEYKMPDLAGIKFVGLLTYLTQSKNTKTTSAYGAIEIRNGKAESFAGGNICCNCGGEPLVPQQVDAVVLK